jgi:hypothetical protein
VFRAILNTVPLTVLLVAAVVLTLAVHALGPAAIAVVVAVSLIVLLDLCYPFSGDVVIAPDDFRSGALSQFLYGP